jgi:hypothetical protein
MLVPQGMTPHAIASISEPLPSMAADEDICALNHAPIRRAEPRRPASRSRIVVGRDALGDGGFERRSP